MESILQMAQNATINPFGNLVQDFQGAQTNAINNQRGRMQNEQMARQMESAQRLLGIAPQLAESIKASGAPFAEQYGLLVEADPTEAPNILNQMMGFEKANLKYKALQDPRIRSIVEDFADDYLALEQVRQTMLDPTKSQSVRADALAKYNELYSGINQARGQIAYLTQNSSLTDDLMPSVKSPTDFAIIAQDQGLQVEANNRAREMFPIEKQYKVAQTNLAQAQSQQIPQKIASEANADLQSFKTNNAQTIKNVTDSIIALNKLRELKGLADKGNLPAKQAIVFLNARGVTGPGVLTEGDVANTSGTGMVEALAQKANLNQYGTASNYATIYPNTETLFSNEIKSYKDQLGQAVDQFNATRIDPKQRITLESLLPTQTKAPASAPNTGGVRRKQEEVKPATRQSQKGRQS